MYLGCFGTSSSKNNAVNVAKYILIDKYYTLKKKKLEGKLLCPKTHNIIHCNNVIIIMPLVH
jgi:hypothetical protein